MTDNNWGGADEMSVSELQWATEGERDESAMGDSKGNKDHEV